MYYNVICGYKRIILKKDRGNKIGLQNVYGDGRGGNFIIREEKVVLERGIEGVI